LKRSGGVFLVLLAWLLSAPGISAEKIGVLPDVFDPGGFAMAGGEVFLLEGASILVFSLSDLSVKRRFGKEGQGPGELEIRPWLSNILVMQDNRLVVDSFNKTVVFSLVGDLLWQKRRSEQYTQMLPVGSHFVVRKRVFEEAQKKQYSTILRLDGTTEKEKELYRQPFAGQHGYVDVIPDSIHFKVYKDRIYVDKSPEGFVLEVFDANGQKIKEIHKEYVPVAVTRQHRQDYERMMREDPNMQMSQQDWERFKSQTRFEFLEFFPAIQDFLIVDEKIFVQTFRSKNRRDMYRILDLDGRDLGTALLPEVRKPGYTENMMGTGVRLYAIENGRFYYLVDEEEGCVLHVAEISIQK
jgi:hypothetical protein